MWISRSLLVLLFCSLVVSSGECATGGDRVPAVAGQFYPSSAAALRTELEGFFSHATPRNGQTAVQALIVPHAGYVYSGQVAASGVAQIDPQRPLRNIFLIGVSHNAAYDGAAVYVAGDFLTPLGRVRVNAEIGRSLLQRGGMFLENDGAHAVEHSLEVQLPLLQFHLKKPFSIVPILLGTEDPGVCKQVAHLLQPYFTKENLFVISTDLSHYPSYEDAITIDRKTIDAVLSGSPEKLLRAVSENGRAGTRQLATSMCGLAGVLMLQDIVATDRSQRFTLIQYNNSGDVSVGEKSRVVGYAAIAVAPHHDEAFHIRAQDRRRLLAIARATLEKYLQTGQIPGLRPEQLSRALRTPCGAFVTLKKQDDLRGCIGNFSATEELAKTVQNMAIAAATEDYRFCPVSFEELKNLDIEISVLSPMRKVASVQEIELGRHGIYVRKGNRAGTFLPQVARETGWSLEELLGHCSQDKAGIGWGGWKEADVYVYEADVFGESDHAAGR